jgi:hypothetical protein
MKKKKITNLELDLSVQRTLYFVTNTMNLTSFLSLDEILSNKYIEGDKKENYDGSYFDDFLITAQFPLFHEIGLDYNNPLNPRRVILELSPDSISAPTITKLESGFKIMEFEKSITYDTEAIMFFGYLPFHYVKKIIFPTKIEMERFDTKVGNIPIPRHLFEVNQSLFQHAISFNPENWEIELSGIKATLSSEYCEIGQSLHYRNKVKAIIHELLTTSTKSYVSRLSIGFDYVTFKLLNLKKPELSKLNRKMIDFCSSRSVIPISNDVNFLKSLYEGSSPIFELISNLSILSFKNAINRIEFKTKNHSEMDDVKFMFIILKILIENRYLDHFEPSLFLDRIENEIKMYSSFLLKNYTDYFLTVRQILNDLISIRKYVNNTLIFSDVETALLIFLKTPGYSGSEEMDKNIQSFNPSDSVKRLIHIFYAGLNGYGSLSAESKQNPYLNRVCDDFAFGILPNSYLVNASLENHAFFTIHPKHDDYYYDKSSNFPFSFEYMPTEDDLEIDSIFKSVVSIIDDVSNENRIIKQLHSASKSLADLLPIKISFSNSYIPIIDDEMTTVYFDNNMDLKREFDYKRFLYLLRDDKEYLLKFILIDRLFWKNLIKKLSQNEYTR